MKAHLIDTHLLVPGSMSSAKVKVKYRGHVSQKMGVSGALVFHKHILFILFWSEMTLNSNRKLYQGGRPLMEIAYFHYNISLLPVNLLWFKISIIVLL